MIRLRTPEKPTWRASVPIKVGDRPGAFTEPKRGSLKEFTVGQKSLDLFFTICQFQAVAYVSLVVGFMTTGGCLSWGVIRLWAYLPVRCK